ncbi:hypothetical protein CRENPOLYSF2_2220013 [Crenothrix polyspora]|uniref:Uncharacterized protein n=1 Tax=Crenothrix polyspora TaxID=360316 RepID=A0A1R4H5A1_9GAMM|nr:hypothetical protein CRENPOLYSF2_2220013 [Crenothrix polyspora]
MAHGLKIVKTPLPVIAWQRVTNHLTGYAASGISIIAIMVFSSKVTGVDNIS